MESTRLPGKALLPFGHKTVITYLLGRLSTLKDMSVITAIPSDETSNPLCDVLKKEGFSYFRGSHSNVWQRFVDTLNLPDHKHIEHFIRVTADNPFTSLQCITGGLATHLKQKADLTVIDHCPVGAGVDIIRKQTFLSIDPQQVSQEAREHIIPWFLNASFHVARHRSHFPEIAGRERWTIDTWTDYLSALHRLNSCENDPFEL